MAEKAFIYIDDLKSETAEWLFQNRSGKDSFETIAGELKFQEVILILNGKYVYTSTVKLANANLSQIQKAVPFALEDELAEDIEQLHFAYGEVTKGEPVSVAVIKKILFGDLIEKLKALNIQIIACYVDYLLLPFSANHWSVGNVETISLVKTAQNLGFFTPQPHLESLLKIQIDHLEYPPESIDVYDIATKTDKALLAGIPITTHATNAQTLLSFLSQQFNENYKGINLLQGRFKATKKYDRAKKIWWLAAACAVLWLFVNGIATISSYVYYSHKEKQLTAEVDKIYKQVFPDSTTIVSPKIRIERELQKYQQANTDDGFISLVEKVGPIVKQANDIKIENFEFQNKRGILTIKTSSFQDLQNFANALNRTGLPIQQTNAKSENKGVVASFNITMPGS